LRLRTKFLIGFAAFSALQPVLFVWTRGGDFMASGLAAGLAIFSCLCLVHVILSEAWALSAKEITPDGGRALRLGRNGALYGGGFFTFAPISGFLAPQADNADWGIVLAFTIIFGCLLGAVAAIV
jgi:hypothetical protein